MNSGYKKSSVALAELITEDASLKINNGDLENIVNQLSTEADDKAIVKVISLFKKAITKLEQQIWKNTASKKNIKQYQDTFKALEKLYELKSTDARYNFRVIIPVADRPQHNTGIYRLRCRAFAGMD